MIEHHAPGRPRRRSVLAAAGAAAATLATTGGRAEAASATGGSSMPAEVAAAHNWTPGPGTDFTRVGSLAEATDWTQGWYADSPTSVSGPVNENETAAYDPANLSFDSAGVHLRLSNSQVTSRGRTFRRTGAQLTSSGRITLTPGCWVEARMNLPGDAGGVSNWPGFWLDGVDTDSRQWPQYGEIDIMEGLSGVAAWNYHWGPQAGWPTYNVTGRSSASMAGWHVFAAHWEADRITVYYDGVQLGEPVTSHVQTDPHYIIIGHSTRSYDEVGGEVICSSVRTWTHS